MSMPAGRVVFGTLITAMIAALVRAIGLASVRALEIRTLIQSTSTPSPRLERIARSCGVTARELTDDAPICALAGLIAPTVLVTTGALAAISDDELRAALHHERAHARRGDQVLAAVLSFLVDLLPLPALDLVATYKRARELAADGAAAAATDADSLAGALIEFAKGGRKIAGVASLCDGRSSTMTQRLNALLVHDAPRRSADTMRRFAVTLALAVIATTGIMTPVLASQRATSCAYVMKADR